MSPLVEETEVRPIPVLEAADRLLYLSAFGMRQPLDPEAIARMVSGVEDWDAVLRRAAKHRLLARLYLSLKKSGASSLLESGLWEKIQRAHHRAQAFTLSIENEWAATLRPALSEEGIDHMLLKGLALLQTVYRDHPIRFFSDVDLLIRPSDFPRVRSLLEKLGYRTRRAVYPSAWHARELRSGGRQAHFVYGHPEREVLLDLHLEIFEAWSPFQLSSDPFWQAAEPLEGSGSTAFLPSPTHLFLHLLFHLAKNVREGNAVLGWMADLDETLRYFGERIHGKICSDQILAHRHLPEISQILLFLEEELRSPFPSGFAFNRPGPPQASFLKAAFSPQSGSNWRGARPESSARFFFYWKQVRGLRKRTRLLFGWVFPSVEYLATKYPTRGPFQVVVAYFRHWALMGSKAGRLL